MRFIQTLQVLLLFVVAQQVAPSITAPVTGQTVSGQISIMGTADAPNFASAELALAYTSDSTGTWFTLQTFTQPVQNSTLAAWDTTLVSDGDYTLRLRVFSLDGSFQDFTVTDLHVRNAIVPPTPTATVTQSPTVTPSLLPTDEAFTPPPISPTPLPTEKPVTVLSGSSQPTPLPANPAALTSDSIYSNFGRGAILALILFIVLGIFLRLRHN